MGRERQHGGAPPAGPFPPALSPDAMTQTTRPLPRGKQRSLKIQRYHNRTLPRHTTDRPSPATVSPPNIRLIKSLKSGPRLPRADRRGGLTTTTVAAPRRDLPRGSEGPPQEPLPPPWHPSKGGGVIGNAGRPDAPSPPPKAGGRPSGQCAGTARPGARPRTTRRGRRSEGRSRLRSPPRRAGRERGLAGGAGQQSAARKAAQALREGPTKRHSVTTTEHVLR